MINSPQEFRKALDTYTFPSVEPIYSIPFGLCKNGFWPPDPFTWLFRSCGDRSGWHKTMPDFWASVLYNFLEDCGVDEKFEKLGARGEYRKLDHQEGQIFITQLLGSISSNYIRIPSNIESCILVYNEPDLKAVVGSDVVSFFAVICGNWTGVCST